MSAEWTVGRLIEDYQKSADFWAKDIIPLPPERAKEEGLRRAEGVRQSLKAQRAYKARATAAALRRLEALEGFVGRVLRADNEMNADDLACMVNEELNAMADDPRTIGLILQSGNPEPEGARDDE